MAWLVDLRSQVRRILPWRFGGTGNDKAAAIYTVRRMSVRRAETIDPGMIVRSREFDKADAWDDDAYDDALGVVLGLWRDDGRIDEAASAGQFDFVAVVTAGVVRVLLHESVEVGEYAFPTAATTGAARGETDPDVGSIGRFVSMGSAGGYAYVKLGGGGGGGGGAAFTDAQVEATFILPTAGDEIETRVPWDGTIAGWEITGDDGSAAAVVDVYVDAFANYPPDAADSITGSAPPTLSGDHDSSSTLTGWTTALSKGSRMIFHVDSVSVAQRLTVTLLVDRSS